MKLPGFLKPAKAPEPIFCCSSAVPPESDGLDKVHNDPHRDIHTAIFSSFMEFAIRRQRHAILMQLALSHVDDDTASGSAGITQHALLSTTGSTCLDGQFFAENLPAHTVPDLPTLVGPVVETDYFSHLTSGSNADQVSTAGPAFTPPDNFWQAALGYSSSSLPVAVNCNVLQAPTLAEPSFTDQTFAPFNHQIYQSQPTVATKCSPASHTSPRERGLLARLSVKAQPFVPGKVRGSLPPAFATAIGDKHLSSPRLSTPTTFPNKNVMGQFIPETEVKEQHEQDGKALTIQAQVHSWFKAKSATPENSTAEATTSQQFSGYINASTEELTDQYYQDLSFSTQPFVGETPSRDRDAFGEKLNDLKALEKEAEELIINSQAQTIPAIPTATHLKVCTPEVTAAQPYASPFGIPLFGSLPLASPSVFSSTSLPDSNDQSGNNLALISPASTQKQKQKAYSSFQQNFDLTGSFSSSPTQPTSLKPSSVPFHGNMFSSHHSHSASMHQTASSSHSSMLRPHAASFHSHSHSLSTISQPEYQAQPGQNTLPNQQTPPFQPQAPAAPSPPPIFNINELINNPLTEETSYVIHLTSRYDYGPVISHRYFICPQELTHDWTEVTKHQWFARGAAFSMLAEKWDVKCADHVKFFRMTLRPNLKMRDPTWKGRMIGPVSSQ